MKHLQSVWAMLHYTQNNSFFVSLCSRSVCGHCRSALCGWKVSWIVSSGLTYPLNLFKTLCARHQTKLLLLRLVIQIQYVPFKKCDTHGLKQEQLSFLILKCSIKEFKCLYFHFKIDGWNSHANSLIVLVILAQSNPIATSSLISYNNVSYISCKTFVWHPLLHILGFFFSYLKYI